jgi:hypothetical protein
MTGAPRLLWAGAVAILALLSFFVFPGHSYLAADSQVYSPILERLHNPVLLERDIVASRPNLAYTWYDEITLAMTDYTGLSIERALELQHFLYRALGIAGVFLIAAGLGLDPVSAWFVAAIFSLGMSIEGPALNTVETEPVPRVFALSLTLFATGLAISRRFTAAGIAGALAFLYHGPTSAPFWIVAAASVLRRKSSARMLAPLVPALVLLAWLAHSQAGMAESPALFSRLDAFQENLQRSVTPYVFVSEWKSMSVIPLAVEFAIVALALWRLRDRLKGPACDFLVGLPLVGVAAIPLSWILLEQQHWAAVPQWQPARATLLVGLAALILSATRAIVAVTERRWMEGAAWMIVAFALPLKTALITWFSIPVAITLVVSLAGLGFAGALFMRQTRGVSLAAAALLPFFAIAGSGVAAAPRVETTELDQLAQWAREQTPEDAVFLFTNFGHGGEPGVFRERALRAVYVDWRTRGHVGHFPAFAAEWSRRWRDSQQGRWKPSREDLPKIWEMHADFAVAPIADAIPGQPEAFRNAAFVVYRAAP